MPSVEIFEIRQLDQKIIAGERVRILTLLRGAVPFAEIMEVGSTALSGVIGKQDIDFAARVAATGFCKAREILDELFARSDHQLSNSEFQGYVVPSPLDVSVQLFHANGQYDTFEDFIRLLAASADLRGAYNQMKSVWNGRPMAEYRIAKADFIEKTLRQQRSKGSKTT